VDRATDRKNKKRNTGVLHYVQDDDFKGKGSVQGDGFRRKGITLRVMASEGKGSVQGDGFKRKKKYVQDDGFKKEMNTSERWLQKEKNWCFVVFGRVSAAGYPQG
jgi:hypothetical protein